MGGTVEKILDDPISAVATVVGYTLGGPVGAGIANTVAGVAQGESPEDAIKGGALAAAGSYVGGEVFGGATGGAETGAFDSGLGLDAMSGGAGTVVPGGLLSPYELTQSNIDPALLEGMSAEQVTQAAIRSPYYAAAQSNIDPLLLEGMNARQVAMAPVLNSAVLPTGLTTGSFGLKDVFRGAQLANTLFARPQMPQVNPYQLMQQQQDLYGNVDYTPTLNLLATRPTPQSLV